MSAATLEQIDRTVLYDDFRYDPRKADGAQAYREAMKNVISVACLHRCFHDTEYS